MGMWASIGIFRALAMLLAAAVFLANRRARVREEEKRRRERERLEKEKALMATLKKTRHRDPVAQATKAVRDDPKGAAKVVSRMLRDS